MQHLFLNCYMYQIDFVIRKKSLRDCVIKCFLFKHNLYCKLACTCICVPFIVSLCGTNHSYDMMSEGGVFSSWLLCRHGLIPLTIILVLSEKNCQNKILGIGLKPAPPPQPRNPWSLILITLHFIPL